MAHYLAAGAPCCRERRQWRWRLVLLRIDSLLAHQFATTAGEKPTGGSINHASYYWLLMAESHLTRRLFGGMPQRIVTLPSPAG